MKKNKLVFWHKTEVTREMRENLNGHRSLVIWFTGLPSSGKSTIAHQLELKLYDLKVKTITLDGDNIRHGLCSDLGFSPEDRSENIRRIGEVIKLLLSAGLVVLCAFVSPFRRDRQYLRNLLGKDFIEIYCRCPIEICAQRDPKGLYKEAFKGLIPEYTGVSAPYEEPENPDLIIDTHLITVEESVNLLLKYILPKIFNHGIQKI
ncbi:adenylylsulfate kinase [Caldimicrobium thiodismutans]|uniref:Adenylyl-sulfate kinase n=1 Tax=Caldimicrobium thiodismutans TaxID=1653476 RepID=A0A0U4N3R2_9BACT|nr:adenylyl-sulfate kinase [Caldimicrobium thiodismutans]BAU23926.1 adenylylsulfate kinase [Caldimicrobium thiodismutans]